MMKLLLEVNNNISLMNIIIMIKYKYQILNKNSKKNIYKFKKIYNKINITYNLYKIIFI